MDLVQDEVVEVLPEVLLDVDRRGEPARPGDGLPQRFAAARGQVVIRSTVVSTGCITCATVPSAGGQWDVSVEAAAMISPFWTSAVFGRQQRPCQAHSAG